MTVMECPRLRTGLAADLDENDPRYIYLWDKLRVSQEPQRLSLVEFTWVRLFDGKRTLREIQTEAMRQLDGTLIPIERFTALAERLDGALLLDGPKFRERLEGPIREPSCLGCYAKDPAELRCQLRGLFTGKHGPGLPLAKKVDGKLRAALIPHIDYNRGGTTFAWGFKEVFEHTDASLFVIIGTSHCSTERYTLTRKDFKTPLGVAKTDQNYIDRLVNHYGDGLFDDETAHLPEHSIELEVVFLQYLYEECRPFRIVPLVVGPFQDAVDSDKLPSRFPDIGRMVEALRRVEGEIEEPICYIISGDLAHIGPKFGDPDPVKEPFLARSRSQDQLILQQTEKAGADGYFRVIAEEKDERRICGLPPTYTVLEAVRPSSGKVLHYDQYADRRGFESVSFASVAFYR
jgi:AmmeMemoRadiSam system protein B